MTTSSVSCSHEALHLVDGVVFGTPWSEHLCRELLDSLCRVIPAAPDEFDGDECFSDVDIAARLFYQVLRAHSGANRWPVFSGPHPRPSLVKTTVLYAVHSPELAAVVRLSNESALAAANVARWLLKMPQQSSPTVVFVSPPSLRSRRPIQAPRQPAALVG